MNYGLYLSAGGALTNSYRQDVIANNLANVNTVAFKPDVPTLRSRPAEAVEDLSPAGTAQELLDQLGGGVLAAPQRTSFAAGPVQQTGRALDVALADDGAFLAVRTTDPATGQAAVRLTRDGRLNVDAEGRLTDHRGHALLNADDGEIRVQPGVPVDIGADGAVRQNGEAVARLTTFTVADPQQLEKTGANLFAFSGADPRQVSDRVRLHPGSVEGSGTNAVASLMQMMKATKAASGNLRMIEYHDRMMDGAVNTLGRVG